MSRYPPAIAASTAPTVSSGLLWKTPSPRAGISTPLISVIRGLLAVMVVSSPWWTVSSTQATGRRPADKLDSAYQGDNVSFTMNSPLDGIEMFAAVVEARGFRAAGK